MHHWRIAANNTLSGHLPTSSSICPCSQDLLAIHVGSRMCPFTNQMYARLGDQWASTLLAFLGLACCAIPYVFWFYGERIRAFSRFAYVEDEETKAVPSDSEH